MGRLRYAALAAVLCMLGGLLVAAPARANAAGPVPHYLMTAFTNSSESNMYVYDSADATRFTLQRANAYTPPSGLVRDPSVIRHTDGYYYLVYTTGWTGNTIGIARSSDYLTWTFQRNVTISVAPANGSTWAPEWFVDSDGSVHVVVSVSQTGTAGQFQPYRITATNAALSAWSAPAALAGIGTNHIDSFIVKVGNTYHNFMKNETTKYIEHATAPALTGPWSWVGTGNWAGWGSGLEGPALVRLPDNRWRIYFDQYGAGRYYSADSSDLYGFTGKTELAGLSGTVRHFTVLRESVGDSSAPPTGNRSLRSANFPDRYVRHRDNVARIDVLGSGSPLADRQDATFQIVPGLANASCYSFRAVNGSYLRHWDFTMRLAGNDGSAVFAGDATFCSRTGLAGGGSYSFESWNHPGRYLRHYDYVLRVDPYAAGSTFAGDASYTLTTPLA
ncbi:glycoside hydrolase family 43 protein [Micromonospora sp. RL09-050-HVF-A]|uniref:glycoside hydrolase family 43 protein n=1 Tax=unclassified Micromonospora TaxID=2617518 RepID=UPI001C5D59B2|nr:glycoside hydrolase family 43 protein [Micromonospora sp. RL09-050-HVF-A]MBW4700792.1 AbfB domain-containing protein [Micromonospora sp. RL09-050-HVF-A]